MDKIKEKFKVAKNIFFYAGMDKKTYRAVEPALQQENRRILQYMSIIAFVILATMTAVNFSSEYLNVSSIYYAIGALMEAVIFGLCLGPAKRSGKIMPVLVHVYALILYTLGISLATLGSLPDEATVTFFILIILVPVMFNGRPLETAVLSLLATLVFIFFDKYYKNAGVYARDLTNAIVFEIMGISIGTWLMQTRAGNQRLLHETEIINHELEQAKNSISRAFGMVEGLSQEYHTLWLVDRETRKLQLVRSSGVSTIQNAVQMGLDYQDYDTAFEKYINTYIEPQDRKRAAEEIQWDTVLEKIAQPGIYAVNYLRRTDDGTVGYHQLAFANAGADKKSFVFGFRDVDSAVKEEQRQKQLLQDALDAAEYANKAKTTFLNNMSHDIRTPMNAIVGFTALAASHIDNRDQVQDYLSKINSSSQHLLSLINDVLDMSRIESGTVKIDEKAVHLPNLLHDLRTIIQVSVATKQLDFFIDTVDVENENVICDPMRLNQVLINLVSNAIKFTQPGGFVSVRLVQKPGAGPQCANYEFRVKDNGIGMSPEFTKHVFESFAREENSTVSKIQGTGLGMAITKNIVDMMGGTISVASEKGKGTEFVLSLTFKTADDGVKPVIIPQLQGARALVVDDDSNCCVSVSEMLGRIGMRADWTLSGREAVLRAEVAYKQKDEYGAYIIDWMMPDMNGIETVRRIRRVIGSSTPIIILTTYDWADIEQEAREAGVTAFCSKPIFMSELQEVLSRPFRPTPPEEEKTPVVQDFTGQSILLTEDNELNQEIATEILREYGFTVDVAEDGDVAVAKMSVAGPGQYDLILMDVQMPRMNGYEATRQIRAMKDPEKAGIPIIAMTANAFEEDRRAALAAGMNEHLAKPIEIPKLLEVLSKVLRGKD